MTELYSQFHFLHSLANKKRFWRLLCSLPTFVITTIVRNLSYFARASFPHTLEKWSVQATVAWVIYSESGGSLMGVTYKLCLDQSYMSAPIPSIEAVT